jgi:hypothetical protein
MSLVISHKGVTGIFVIKFSQAISHVNVRLKTNVSENNSVSIVGVDMRSDHNLLIFLSMNLVDAIFLLASCVAEGESYSN